MSASRYQLPSPGAGTAELTQLLRESREGRLNVAYDITLANGTTQTKFSSQRIGHTTIGILIPRSAAQAAIKWWIAGSDKFELTFGHDAPSGNQTFSLLLIG